MKREQREIKFRAWDFKRKKMYQCDSWHYDGEYQDINFPVIFDNEDTRWDLHREDGALELMQYTGLKDKNGKEIYEGDIVNVTTNHIANIDPEWPKKTTTVEVRCENAVWWFGDMTMIYEPLRNAEIEIIGNIYENPELLK